MSDNWLTVRATSQFFTDLDHQLGPERGPNGEPSTNDFQVYELFEIIERFATGFHNLPELIPGRSEYRVLVTSGMLVRAFTVVGQLAPDGAVELISLETDPSTDWP
ncbi:MAG: hypothetical protein GY745_22840 [Actinomycetia bacterium]|nr:hypothetical protein [Actinomycetes bacterium]